MKKLFVKLFFFCFTFSLFISCNVFAKCNFVTANYLKEFEHNKVVFTNGFFNHSSFEYEKNLNAGSLWEKDLQSAFNDRKTILVDKEKNPLSLLNNAFFTDGLYLNVKKGFQLNKPLVIYNVFDSTKITNFFKKF